MLEWVRNLKNDREKLDELFDPGIKEAHLEHKSRLNVKSRYAVPIDEAERIAKEKIAAGNKKLTAEREAKRLKDEKDARDKAEAERKERQRVADEAAEVERVARVKREAEEKARRLAEEIESGHLSAFAEDEQRTAQAAAALAAKAGNERMAREAAAEAARLATENAEREAREKTEREAREATERAAQATRDAEAAKERERVAHEAEVEAERVRLEREKTAKKETTAAKPKGASFTTAWSGVVVSDVALLELVKAVAAGTVPIGALQPNQSWIDGYAQSVEGAVPLPGVVYVSEERVAVRR